jgi:hypothetical protein
MGNYLRPTIVSLVTAIALMFSEARAQPEDALSRISRTVVTGESAELLRQLTDEIGARLAGSAAYERAVQWAVEKFRETGITDVRREAFVLPNSWLRGHARARIVNPVARDLRVGSVGWGPSTPAGGVRGELMLVSDLSPATLRSQSMRLDKRIVLIDLEKVLPPDEPLAFARLRNSFAVFKELGVQAVLLPHDAPGNAAGWVDTGNARGAILPLPVGDIGWEDSLLLRRHLARGPVTLEAEWQNTISGPVQVSNVIAEISGSEAPREWVLLGAHLDSWDLGTGAHDNGTGVVMVLEAARAIASLGRPPRRSIRFALWAAEEPGPAGSAMFIKRHTGELRDCVAVLNTDNGAGRPRGWHVNGRTDVREAMAPIAARLQNPDAAELSMDLSCASDDCPFLLEGIPALKLWVDTAQYRRLHHQASDTFDKVDAELLRRGAAVAAMTTYAIADHPGRIGQHIGEDAVRQLLRSAGLDADLVYTLWRP